ncbi:MAG: transposase [Deltaproteobacteria bacterium]|nr:transposase [Deltaproteobacteria bacterium]MBW1983364.1 transposase [Deltaproteobacteria bacterium]
MARQWRIEFPGAIYHVMSRGNARQDIFRSDDDRKLFLFLLSDLSERYETEIYAYVLMNNHYHLLLKTKHANLSKAMQWFGTTYTRKFNLINLTSGHLFQGRFKSIIVENDAYLLRLSCYIHRNPLKAGIVQKLSDYPWSSYRFYAYKKKPPKWLNIKTILNQVSGQDRHRAYRTKVRQYSDEQGSVMDDIKHGLIYGSEKFIETIKNRFLKDTKEPELPQHNRLYKAFDPEALLQRASKMLDFDLETAICAKKISAQDKEKRDLLVYWIWKTGRLSNQEIGTNFGLTYSAVSKIVSQFSDRQLIKRRVEATLNRLNSQFKV